MPDSPFEWFFKHYNEISISLGVTLFFAHWVKSAFAKRWPHKSLKEMYFEHTEMGALGASLPTGIAILMGGFNTGLVPAIGNSNVQLGLAGAGIVYYTFERLRLTFFPPRRTGSYR
jgi:hypothetical protein